MKNAHSLAIEISRRCHGASLEDTLRIVRNALDERDNEIFRLESENKLLRDQILHSGIV